MVDRFGQVLQQSNDFYTSVCLMVAAPMVELLYLPIWKSGRHFILSTYHEHRDEKLSFPIKSNMRNSAWSTLHYTRIWGERGKIGVKISSSVVFLSLPVAICIDGYIDSRFESCFFYYFISIRLHLGMKRANYKQARIKTRINLSICSAAITSSLMVGKI